MLDRRQFLAAASGSFVAACTTTTPTPAPIAATTASGGEAELNTLFDQFMDEILTESPQLATSLGLDKGAHAAAKSKLNEASLEAQRAFYKGNAERLRRLRAFERRSLSGMPAANYDTVEFQMETNARISKFEWGDGVLPYVVTQRDGAYEGTPNFLDRQHTIETREDADAYIARLRAFAVVLDQETERVKHDAGLGVIPPDFVIERAVQQIRALRAIPTAESVMITSIAARTQKKGIAGNYATDAARILELEIYPALDRQAAYIDSLRSRAAHDAGIGRLPNSAEFYQIALRHFTTTGLSAEEIHQLGLQQAAELSSQMDAILRSKGLTQGSVGARVQALNKDPQYLYPNTDAGRQEILDYCNSLIAALQPKLPQYFGRLPKTPVEVKRIPAYTEAGAAGGYYQRPALDGSRPGAFFINLRNTAELPRWTLPTLTYHESAPGHHFQLALVIELPGLPLIRKSGQFSANTEGWALYAEQLCDEMGLYENDVLGKLGRLQATIFRAARCVVDTGLHSKGWSREKAIDYMVETTGDNREAMTTEVERYCVYPGQATSYKVGHTRWVQLRENARAKLGSKFDIRAFHDTGLTAGPMPMAVLERVYNDWIASQA
jgi:uncharacterized protein (DUF885 family)